MKNAWYIVLILMLSSCGVTSPGRLDTPNGNPQVTIAKDARTVRAACLDWLLTNGYRVDNESNNSGIVLQGTNRSVQITFNLLNRDSTQTTVYAFESIWTSTPEQTSLFQYTDQQTYNDLQADLRAIQKNVGGQ
jgi:hypothetical protein